MAEQSVSPEELKLVAQRAAGKAKVNLVVDVENEAGKVAPELKDFYCKLGLPDCKYSKQEIMEQVAQISSPRAVVSSKSCTIAMDLRFYANDLVNHAGRFLKDSYAAPTKETVGEAINYAMLHEGSHCRNQYSKEAISLLRKQGDASLFFEERARHEVAAEVGAALFTLKDIYKLGDNNLIEAVRGRVSETGEYYRYNSRPEERRFYSGIPDAIKSVLELSHEKVKSLSDEQIRGIVDTVAAGGQISL
jgi:hypothetical protein